MNAYTHLKESSFPDYYRQEEVQTLQQVIKRRRSSLIGGLSGMGKSNLVRFFVSHPTLQDDRIVTIYIDCNLIEASSDNELYAAIIVELGTFLIDGEDNLPAAEIDNLWALKQTLKTQIKQFSRLEKYLVIVLDRFEQFFSQKDALYNFLRHLRDIFGKRISYVLATRHCPSRASLGELSELFNPEHLWIGPLKRRDAYDSIDRDGKRLRHSFDDEQKKKLYELTGGHPGLLKNACDMAVSGLDLSVSLEKIAEQLLENPNIRKECSELWSDLDEPEKDELEQRIESLNTLNTERKQSLYAKGILVQDDANHMQFFSPIFQRAIQNQLYLPAGLPFPKLEIRRNKVFIGNVECPLTEKEFLLVKLLLEKRGEIVTYDDVAFQVWPEYVEDSVGDELIHALKSSLERKLKTVREVEYIRTHRNRGYELL